MFRYVLAAVLLATSKASGSPYAWPLERFTGCASLFGDYRPLRYHAGVDLRTDGAEGWPVLAVADGYVMRASTSYYGYGRALYLKLDDGRIAVYGHLQSFGPQVTARIRAEQRRLRRYATNLYFETDAIRVTRGMVVAKSGQTGSGPPHLHFELRSADNRPLNPLTHGLALPDGRDPVITKLWLYPRYRRGRIGYGPEGTRPAEIALQGTADSPLRPAGGPIRAGGPIGLAVEAHDRRSNGSLQSNVYALLLKVGDDTVFAGRYDSLRYETMAQVTLERPLRPEGRRHAYYLFKPQGNRLEHSRVHGRYPEGLIDLKPGDSALPFEVTVLDDAGNRRTILGLLTYADAYASEPAPAPGNLEVTGSYMQYLSHGASEDMDGPPAWHEAARVASWQPVPGTPGLARLYAADLDAPLSWRLPAENGNPARLVSLVHPERPATLTWSGAELEASAGSVYAPGFLSIGEEAGADGVAVWRVGPDDLDLAGALKLSLAAPGDTTWCLFRLSKGDRLGFVERQRHQGRISCTIREPGRFTLARDTVPPTIRRVTPRAGSQVSAAAIISARLEDDLSGVGDDTMIEVLLDGEWLIPEYDPETYQLQAEPWSRLSAGEHALEIRVRDRAGNLAVSRSRFRVGR